MMRDMKRLYGTHRFPASGLQLFAGEGEDGGTGDGNGGGSGARGSGAGGTGGGELLSFDDFLKQGSNQTEFDRRMAKAVQTAVKNAQEKWEALQDDKLSEAEKLAKMTKEERINYKNQQLQKELDAYKQRENLAAMSKTARKMLEAEEISIPDELLGHLVAEDAEQTKASVESFAKLYKAAVQTAVKDALKGKPPKGGQGGTNMTRDQIMAVKNPSERQKLIAEHMELFQ